MLCRACIWRAAGSIRPAQLVTRSFGTSSPSYDSPELSTPLAKVAGSSEEQPDSKASISSCPAGTVLNGLNYLKGKTDPIAKPDDEYPEWLWNCLDVLKKNAEEAAEDAGDEFSKSKKQRRLAAKRQRQLEARLLASGDIEALAPKVPLQQQTINLPAGESGRLEDVLAAAAQRDELRKAMRKERRAKIRETNYLKSM
ncbi:hypothetical protein VTK73DRAFT_9520 [Phialemonium thermophilum]|uniref:Large ribosomal subunit protein mL54 n=1 Tax=Phialemonium thermophilum TaxID=223376 RepID=A0ABR3Y5Q7_9PEZI